jgi:hypothetical protein
MGDVVSLREWKAARPLHTSATFTVGGTVITIERAQRQAVDPYENMVNWMFYYWGLR